MPSPSGAASIARTSILAGFLAAACGAWAAQLDLVPDAVLGKDSFVAPAGGPASATNLAGVAQVAEDPVEGTLWVADPGAHRVLRFASAAAFANGEAANLVLGQPDFTSSAQNRGGPPGAGTLSGPVGVAVDQAGRVYVSEDGNHRILVFRQPHANGMEASAVIGQADFTSGAANRGGVAATNTLSHPRHLALDGQGELVVADTGNHRVLRFRAPATTGAAAYRVHGLAGPGATATALNAPQGVAFGADGRLWIADTGNHRVVRIDRIGNATADLVLCQASFTANASGTAADACAAPSGVAVDHAGAVYVADAQNSRVLRFASPAVGAAATAVIGQADFVSSACNAGAGVTASNLCNPGAVGIDRDGNALVSDAGNARVLRFDLPAARSAPALLEISPAVMPERGGPFTLTVNGLYLYGGSAIHWDGSPLATQHLSNGRLIAQVGAGQLAAGGTHEVTVVTPGPGGGVSTAKPLVAYPRAPLDASADRVLGQFDFGPVWNPASQWVGEERLGATNAAQVGGIPAHAVVDPLSGRLFVAGILDSRVMSWPSAKDFHNAQSADVILGAPDAFAGSACTDPATTFCGPVGLAVDGSGAVYVSDSGSHRVLRFAPPFVTGMAATQVFGQAGSLATRTENKGGIGAGSLSVPLGIAAIGTTLFVHDHGNSRLLVFHDAAADTTADVVIGQADMQAVAQGAVDATRISGGTGSGATVPSSRWGGLAVDRAGRLYFADGALNRILRFSPPFSNGMAADLVIGQQGFGTSAPGVTATTLDGPSAIAVDAGGGVIVVDHGNHRVLRYAAPLQAGMAATGVLGQAGFDAGIPGSGPASLASPGGVATDRVGGVFVVDAGARLLAFDRPFAVPVARGDVDGNGKSDLFWREAPGAGLSWWTMAGAAVTAANFHAVAAEWQVAATGDLNGDGKADLVWRRASDGATYLWLLDGFAFKGFADLGVLSPAAWSLVGTGDLDGDGKDDIVWRGADGTVYAWLMNGGVIVSQGVISNPGSVWVIADLADMNGDGKADIVFRNSADGGIYVYFMNGLAIASGGYVGAVDPAVWTLAGAADFSGDGKADFMWRHTSGDTWVWLMDGATFQAAGGIGNPGTSWSVRAFGDFDGDGKSDLVWRHTDGTTYLWRMNGLAVTAFEPVANPGGSWDVVAP